MIFSCVCLFCFSVIATSFLVNKSEYETSIETEEEWSVIMCTLLLFYKFLSWMANVCNNSLDKRLLTGLFLLAVKCRNSLNVKVQCSFKQFGQEMCFVRILAVTDGTAVSIKFYVSR